MKRHTPIRDWIVGLREIILRERHHENDQDFSLRLQAWRHGFLTSTWTTFDLDSAKCKEYLPDFAHLIHGRRLNKDLNVFQNKLLFEAFYGAVLRVPRTVCILDSTSFLPLPGGVEIGVKSFESMIEWSKRVGGMFWKPRAGAGGQGAYKITYSPENGFALNGRSATLSDLEALRSQRSDFLVCELIKQAEYSDRIYNRTANTIRIRTLRDRRTGETFVSNAYHRFGAESSYPVDNIATGGLAAPIELESGELKKAAIKPKRGKIQWLSEHPDTQARIEGVKIPNWEKVLTDIRSAADMYKNITCCGWDVIVTENSFYVLEGNNMPQNFGPQLLHGMLRDPRTRRYYVDSGVISR